MDDYFHVGIGYVLSAGEATGLILGEDRLDTLLVLCLWRNFPNSPLLFIDDCEPCKSSKIV